MTYFIILIEAPRNELNNTHNLGHLLAIEGDEMCHAIRKQYFVDY